MKENKRFVILLSVAFGATALFAALQLHRASAEVEYKNSCQQVSVHWWLDHLQDYSGAKIERQGVAGDVTYSQIIPDALAGFWLTVVDETTGETHYVYARSGHGAEPYFLHLSKGMLVRVYGESGYAVRADGSLAPAMDFQYVDASGPMH